MNDNEIIKPYTDRFTGKNHEVLGRIQALRVLTTNKDIQEDLDNILDLCRRQQAEIEKLNVELVGMRGACESYKMNYDKAQAEIERLRKETSQTIESIRKLAIDTIRDTKSEAIKEFAERLKDEFVQGVRVYNGYASVKDISKNIDNLVKEMVSDTE